MNYNDIKKYTANRQQIMRLRTFRYEGGRAQGVLASEVQSGQLLLTVAADRCMDIYELMYKGVNVGFINRMGVCAPAYYDAAGENFQYTFTAGFMSTCGLASFGAPCFDMEALGQHGRIGACPAESFCARYTEDNGLGARLSGEMVQSRLFKEGYRLKREYNIGAEESFTLTDTITNESSREVPFQLLYHINFGYPFLDTSCELLLPTGGVTVRDSGCEGALDTWSKVEPPVDGAPEVCFYHRMKTRNGRSAAGLYNHNLGIGVIYTFDAKLLDNFIQWKYPCSGEYVLGLEPCNSIVTGRDQAREQGRLKTMQPFQSVTHTMEFRFFDQSSLKDIREELKQYNQ